VFTLVGITYLYFLNFGSVKPYSINELLIWTTTLSSEYKVALLSSLLTISGFLIAFQTASTNWKQQMKAQLNSLVANEIEQFYSEVSNLVSSAEIYAESIIDAVSKIQNGIPDQEAIFKIKRIIERTSSFLATRIRLSELSIEVHRILGKNYSLLSTAWGATKSLEQANKAFAEIAQKMWVRPPYLQPEDPDIIDLFLSQVNVAEYNVFIDCCSNNCNFINGATGGIRGQLLSQIVGFNFATYVGLLTDRSKFKEAIGEFYDVGKKVANPKIKRNE
jgi:hypothetical protein